MPIVEVEMVAERKHVAGLAARIAHDLAPIFGGVASATWVKLRTLDVHDYAEGDGGPSSEVRPAFVTILRADPPAGDDLQDEVRQVTEAVAAVIERPPENVHVLYEPPGRGRVAFGGQLVD